VCPSVCPAVCPSVTSRYCIETTGRKIELVLAWMLPSTYAALHYEEIWVSTKIRILFSGNLSQTPDFEHFATASRSRCQQSSFSRSRRSSFTVEFVDDTYTTIDESRLFTTSRSTVTLKLDSSIYCRFVEQLVSTVDKILPDIARRAVRLW